VAANTGTTNISGTMIDRIEIPTANLGVLPTASSIKEYLSNFDNNRHPELNV